MFKYYKYKHCKPIICYRNGKKSYIVIVLILILFHNVEQGNIEEISSFKFQRVFTAFLETFKIPNDLHPFV